MRATWVMGMLAGLALLAAGCGDNGGGYPDGLANDAYDLAAMSLLAEDLPPEFEKQTPGEFENEAWAAIFQTDDVEAKLRQLEAQGRLRNYVSLFGPKGLGPVLAVTAISTLYEDAGAAERSLREFACGLPIEANVRLEPQLVPAIGDGASGFLVRQFEEDAPTFVDATVCFRTGRVVHAVQATSVAGVEDIGFVIRLAERMLARTDAAFAKAEG
ncbi:hypothetical protein [Tepidiforma thermophila]|uniref:Uncharacterized protein n=1 Tax=Tepidiforma thermophila (strain KCTC 52669 / CGMCC 1.13589 / G233) TaxID=2761530 RepID=A0A2A9HBB9_TEPT2|nr:hypothetical protein [Tepidiforma thermophila]PFG73048.1 hypothetical protein A9A59_0241 [Tepidiforma thermophila]